MVSVAFVQFVCLFLRVSKMPGSFLFHKISKLDEDLSLHGKTIEIEEKQSCEKLSIKFRLEIFLTFVATFQ